MEASIEGACEMKVVFIDTNDINENGTLHITETFIKNMKLNENEEVIAYQDLDSWNAKIVFDGKEWGVALISEAKEISKERYEGQREGFWEGYYLQSARMIQVLEKLNYSTDEIERVKDCLGIK